MGSNTAYARLVMRKLNENLANGSRVAAGVFSAALLLGFSFVANAINAAATPETTPAPASPPVFSAGVGDIVKMVDAKVDPQVIRAYIQSSPTAYNPSANEIILLKNRGVQPELLTAMLQRGAEVRAQRSKVAQPAAPAPTATPQYAPAYVAGSQPVYQSYDYAQPVAYSYPYYTYPSTVYYTGGYGGYYPYYWPSFYFGWGGGWGGGCYPYRGYCGYTYPYCGNNGRGGYWGSAYYRNPAYFNQGGYSRGGAYGGAYYRTGAYGGSVTRTAPYGYGGAYRGGTVSAGFSGFTAARPTTAFSGRSPTITSRGGGFAGRMGRGR